MAYQHYRSRMTLSTHNLAFINHLMSYCSCPVSRIYTAMLVLSMSELSLNRFTFDISFPPPPFTFTTDNNAVYAQGFARFESWTNSSFAYRRYVFVFILCLGVEGRIGVIRDQSERKNVSKLQKAPQLVHYRRPPLGLCFGESIRKRKWIVYNHLFSALMHIAMELLVVQIHLAFCLFHLKNAPLTWIFKFQGFDDIFVMNVVPWVNFCTAMKIYSF